VPPRLDVRDPQAIRDAQRPIWNRGAARYLENFAGLLPQAVPPLLDAAGVGAGTRVLDVATGPGLVAAAALERGADAVGVDFAEQMIDEARRRYPAIDFRVADAGSLPFDDASFDAVVVGFGLFLMAEPQRALREARRVSRPGGRVALSVWDASNCEAFDLFYSAMAKHVPAEQAISLHSGRQASVEDPPLFGVTDPDVLTACLGDAGFVDPQLQRLSVVWELPSAEALFDSLSTLRDFEAVPAGALEAFRSEVVAAAAKYERDGRFLIPNPALLLSGTRP